jgi:hypothetical protein
MLYIQNIYFGLEKYLCILKSFEQRRNFTIGFVFHHTDYKLRGGDIRVLSDMTDFASVAHLVR